MRAALATSMTRSRDAVGSPYAIYNHQCCAGQGLARTLKKIEAFIRLASCGTTPMFRRKLSCVKSRMSRPLRSSALARRVTTCSTRMVPDVAS